MIVSKVLKVLFSQNSWKVHSYSTEYCGLKKVDRLAVGYTVYSQVKKRDLLSCD